jgi:hypothetical protein
VAGGQNAGDGDLVITRQNMRRLAAGRRWVKNGDCWTVTATNPDGCMTVQRLGGTGQVVLPADYVKPTSSLPPAACGWETVRRRLRHRVCPPPRVERAGSSRETHAESMSVGLIPKARGVADPAMQQKLREREGAQPRRTGDRDRPTLGAVPRNAAN